jgi:hypothetical protein
MLTSKLVRLAAVVALPLLGVATLGGAAQANVRTVNTGSVCQFSEPDARTGLNVLLDPGQPETFKWRILSIFWSRYDSLYGIAHTEDGVSHPITCNIPRNLPLSTDGMSDVEIRFRSVGPYAGTKTVQCTVQSVRSDDTVMVAATKSVIVPGNVSTVVMDFGAAVNASSSKGFYTVSCNLPDEIGLISIYSSENDGIANN